MEGDSENESKLAVPGEMEAMGQRIRRLSGTIVPLIQNDEKIKGMIMMLDYRGHDGNKEAEKAVHHILYEHENLDQTSDVFYQKLVELLTGVMLGNPIPDHKVSPDGDDDSGEHGGESKEEIMKKEDVSVVYQRENKGTGQTNGDPCKEETNKTEETSVDSQQENKGTGQKNGGPCKEETIKKEEASVDNQPKNSGTGQTNGDKAHSDESNKEESKENENSNTHPQFYIGNNKPGGMDNTIDPESPDVYAINHTVKEHGLAFILTYGQFKSELDLPSRPSALPDKIKMNDILEEYGFKVMACPNAEREKTINFLKEVADEWASGNYDILIGSVSSHGEESVETRVKSQTKEVRHRIFCKDGQTIYTDEDVVHRFDKPKCKNKPKLFFIQACRSRFGEDAKDRGVHLEVTGMLASDINQQQNRGKDTPDARGIRAPPVQQKSTDMMPPVSVPNATQLPQGDHSNQTTRNESGQSVSNIASDGLLTDRGKDSVGARHNQPPTRQELTPPGSGTTITDDSKQFQHEGNYSNMAASNDSSQINIKGQIQSDILTSNNKTIDESEITKDLEENQKTMDDLTVESNTATIQSKPSLSETESSTTELQLHEVTPPPCMLDSLVMFGSAAGKYAYAGEESGGWLLSLVEKALQFQKNNDQMELLQLLTTYVSNTMALDMETITDKREDKGLKSVPCICHMLRKDIYLKPLPSESSG